MWIRNSCHSQGLCFGQDTKFKNEHKFCKIILFSLSISQNTFLCCTLCFPNVLEVNLLLSSNNLCKRMHVRNMKFQRYCSWSIITWFAIRKQRVCSFRRIRKMDPKKRFRVSFDKSNSWFLLFEKRFIGSVIAGVPFTGNLELVKGNMTEWSTIQGVIFLGRLEHNAPFFADKTYSGWGM